MDNFRKFIYNLHDVSEWKSDESDESNESNESNELKVLKTKRSGKYKIIQYEKSLLTFASKEVGLFRSVILNSQNKVVSFAPPKSKPFETFVSSLEDIVAEEFLDGTMIHVFWDSATDSWEIATRSKVGADISFYKSYSGDSIGFREMFSEASEKNNFNMNQLDKKYNYSFVLQHPRNRIVVPFSKPQLYLVKVYEINIVEESVENAQKAQTNIYEIDMEYIKNMELWKSTQIRFPEKYSSAISKMDDINKKVDLYASMNTPYHIVGIMFYNTKTMERCKVRNPVYEYVRHLKGNQSKLQYQYLVLRKEGKVSEYLKYYPENKKELSFYRDLLHEFTSTLFRNYIACYIRKEKALHEYSEQFRTQMYNIHGIYLELLRPQKLSVSINNVIDYVNNLHPSLQMFLLNYSLRKRNVDFIQADANAVSQFS